MVRVAEDRKEIIGLAAQVNSRGRGREDSKKNMFCNHCNRTGHDASGCFLLIGFPDWWGDRPRGGRGNGGKALDYPTADAGRGRGGRARVNNVQTPAAEASSSALAAETGKPPSLGLTDDQWQTLVSLINN